MKMPSNPTDLVRVEKTIFKAQLGLATRTQLLDHGVTDKQVRTALLQGRWLRAGPGLYQLVNWPDGPARHLLGACLLTGGVASHSSAAWLWGLLKGVPAPPVISVPHRLHFHGKGHRRQEREQQHGQCQGQWGRERGWAAQSRALPFPGIVVHRSRDLLTGSISTRHGVPTTNPLRSLVDMAGDDRPALLDEAIDVALATRLVTVEGLVAEAGRLRRQGRKGPAKLLKRLESRGFVGGPSPSVLESRALRLLHQAGIKVVRCQTVVDGGRYRLDIELVGRVFVEVDGYSYHWSPEQKSHDDARQNALLLLGFKVLIYGWQDIVHEPRRVVAEIKAVMAAPR
jgi:very-short-patch-repair endonuclease